MCGTCKHALHMSVMVQIRHVPDDVHRKLKMRAAAAGMPLSEFLLREVTHIAERPSLEEWLARVDRRKPARVDEDSVGAVRAERQSRR